MFNTIRVFAFVALLSLALTACGGGGGGGATTVPTKVILKISASNIPSNTLINNITASVILPAGITPSSLTDDLIDTALIGTVKNASASIVGYNPNDLISLIAKYSLVTNSVNNVAYNARELTVSRLATSGFAPGEFIAINCDIAPGTTVSASDFTPHATLIEGFDTALVNLTGVTLPISVTLQ